MFVEIIKGIEICLLNFICLLLKYCKELLMLKLIRDKTLKGNVAN